MKKVLWILLFSLVLFDCRKWDNPYDRNAVVDELIGVEFEGGIIFAPHLIAAKNDIGNLSWDAAIKACNDYSIVVNGKTLDDWRLPSRDELELLKAVSDKVGNFACDFYWSSTTYDSMNAYSVGFDCANTYFSSGPGGKDAPWRIRPIRSFK